MRLLIVASIALCLAKLIGWVSWPWWGVTAPVWVPMGIGGVLVVALFIGEAADRSISKWWPRC